MCGETILRLHMPMPLRGLSPRVRGNHLRPEFFLWVWGSIPACAGKPPIRQLDCPMLKVYPRVCGETCKLHRGNSTSWGLSPRVRGNLRFDTLYFWNCGSIPACAGKPALGRADRNGLAVYPRVCGETDTDDIILCPQLGLSPRVRGNLSCCSAQNARVRSIPACAGKPRTGDVGCSGVWVYPRVCGETARMNRNFVSSGGLSPRVRGNRAEFVLCIAAIGSIPACAGKPPGSRGLACIPWVYPRVCGETCASQPANTMI